MEDNHVVMHWITQCYKQRRYMVFINSGYRYDNELVKVGKSDIIKVYMKEGRCYTE